MSSDPEPEPLPPGTALHAVAPEQHHSEPPAPVSQREASMAMLAYLGVPFTTFAAPLLVYLASVRGTGFARAHAVAALNVALTALLYTLCALIAGLMLALDSVQVAVLIAVPLAALLWLVVLIVVLRAAAAASRGKQYTIPRWLRVSSR